MAAYIQGRIAEWHSDKGYGFISAAEGNLRAFVHISDIDNKHLNPQVNDPIRFLVEDDKNGKYKAVRASLLKRKNAPLSLVFAAAYLLLVAGLLFNKAMDFTLLWGYLTLSAVTYCAFALDKSAAQSGRWRTKESTLQALSLLGGWPGALCAQYKLRHKSKKQPFKAVLWFAILTNATAVMLYIEPQWRNHLLQLLT